MDTYLEGHKIGILVESEFIWEEIVAYRTKFEAMGATVHFMSRLWNNPSLEFISDVEQPQTYAKVLVVDIDFSAVDINSYSAILMAANYTSVRLRYFETPAGKPVDPHQAASAPAVRFFAEAMINPKIVKGALCHGLWILTPVPHLLKGRRVICHEVVISDIVNAGAIYTYDKSGVIVDGDLVTGRSKNEVNEYIEVVAKCIKNNV